MRGAFTYLRQVFCTHQFKLEEKPYNKLYKDMNTYTWMVKSNTIVASTCMKCGYHQSYYKWKTHVVTVAPTTQRNY